MDLIKIYEGLKAPFPKEAYSKDSSRGFDLTSLKAQYAVERLNEVLGIAGWKLEGDFQEVKGGQLYLGRLKLLNSEREVIHSVEAIGFAQDKKNIGDTYKSARTDALSKATSYIGLGNEMFKGNIDPKTSAPKKSPVKTKSATSKTSSGDKNETKSGNSFRNSVKPPAVSKQEVL